MQANSQLQVVSIYRRQLLKPSENDAKERSNKAGIGKDSPNSLGGIESDYLIFLSCESK